MARIEEIINNYRRSSSTNKLSLLATWEIYREQYGEIAYWCKIVKGLDFKTNFLRLRCLSFRVTCDEAKSWAEDRRLIGLFYTSAAGLNKWGRSWLTEIIEWRD